MKYLICMLLLSSIAQADMESWKACVKKDVKKCGTVVLPKDPNTKLTEKQQKALVCRIEVIVACGKKHLQKQAE